MSSHRLLLLGALLGAALGAQAQGAPQAPGATVRDATTHDASTQRIERIQVEDSGSRIDELRIGGQTRSITVQPKAPVPPYDVQPADMTRPDNRSDNPSGAGRRTWKILQF